MAWWVVIRRQSTSTPLGGQAFFPFGSAWHIHLGSFYWAGGQSLCMKHEAGRLVVQECSTVPLGLTLTFGADKCRTLHMLPFYKVGGRVHSCIL